MIYRLNPALDVSALAARFAEDGRLQIPGFIDGTAAEELHALLRGREDWVRVLNSGDKVIELPRRLEASVAPDRREALEAAVYAGARYGFQYRYETIRVPDSHAARIASDDPLTSLALWLSSEEVLGFLRAVTGAPDIAFADAQATAYSPGDFLTGHDDAIDGKDRRAAYVLGLTPSWRAEWGGLLLFHRSENEVLGVAPAFNTLNLFAVPQVHSVSEVTRAAAYRRYSVTGWLRAGPAPA